MNFTEKSYKAHRDKYNEHFDSMKMESWKEKDTVDYWRHERMYKNLNPLISAYPDASWLTVGDGRYGTDANYLLSQGVTNVLATDISDAYLKIAKEDRFIINYQTENAESLSFADDSFDFVLCKESYHHFPRPTIALYEMLRVARKGIILIEPQDSNILIPSRFGIKEGFYWFVRTIKDLLKSKLGKEKYYHFGNYEEIGNYVYTISQREIEKVALGLNLEMAAFKGLNDHYSEGVEFEKATNKSAKFNEVKKQIEFYDKQVKLGKINYGLLVAMIFKTSIHSICIGAFTDMGFTCLKLPKNPYVNI